MIKLSAYLFSALLAASILFSMLGQNTYSVICFTLTFIPMGLFCYLLDRHERKTE